MDQEQSQSEVKKEMLGYTYQCEGCDMKYKTWKGLRSHQGRAKNSHCFHAAKMARLGKKEEEKSSRAEVAEATSDDSLVGIGVTGRKKADGRRKLPYTKSEKVSAVNAVIKLEVDGVHRVEAMKQASKMFDIPIKKIRLFCMEKELKGISCWCTIATNLSEMGKTKQKIFVKIST